jgi:hypothetical protein
MQEGSNEEVDQIKMSDNQESKWRPLSVSPMLVAIQPHRSAPNQLPAPSNEKVLGHERSNFRRWRQGPQTLYSVAQRQ